MWERQIAEAERHQKLRDKEMLNRRPARPLEFHSAIVKPVADSGMRGLCTKPYPNHPKGCPNYGQRDTCPPQCKLIKDAFDLDCGIWALWAIFDLAAHVTRMRDKQPSWTYRQLSCCLYWQGTVRKALREYVEKWMKEMKHYPPLADRLELITCPEAMGVNVTATMQNIGVTLEWPPQETTRMVYLVGVKK